MSTIKSSSEDLTLNADGSGSDVVIQNNGTETVRVDSSGNVGIGTSSPTYKFQIAAGTDHLITKAVSALNSNIFFDTQNTSTGGSAAIVQRLITSNVAGTGTTSADFQKTKAGALNINNNETNSAAYTRFGVGGSERMRITADGIVDVLGGTIELNGNEINGVQVTIADDAFATITPTGRYAGYVSVVSGGENVFPQHQFSGFLFVDYGDSPSASLVNTGTLFATSAGGPPLGTSGTNGSVTLYYGGTSGAFYLENRSGQSRSFQITLI